MDTPPERRPNLDERGFSLVELLVVMAIIALLAAIAIPAFLRQQEKARDTAAKSDAAQLGKGMIAYFIDGTTAPAVQVVNGRYRVGAVDVGQVTDGVGLIDYDASPATSVTTTGMTSVAWCVQVRAGSGDSIFKFSAQQGLERGACTDATAP